MANKFDYVISNPPYQMVIRTSNNTGISDTTNIFPYFQLLGLKISRKNTMIYPAGRWIRKTGKNCKKFGDIILTEPTLQTIDYFNGQDTKKIFPTVNIGDGVAILLFDDTTTTPYFKFNDIKYKKEENIYIPLIESTLSFIIEKTKHFKKVNDSWSPLSHKFNFNDVNAGEQKSELVVSDKPMDKFTNPIKALINNRSGTKGRTAEYWIENTVETNRDKIPLYKVAINSNIQGNESFNSWSFSIFEPNVIVGQQRIIIKFLEDEYSAVNFKNYMDSKIVRILLTAGAGSRNRIGTNIFSFVPDLDDYSNNNPLFMNNSKLSKDHDYYGLTLEQRLYKYFNFTDKEIFILEKYKLI